MPAAPAAVFVAFADAAQRVAVHLRQAIHRDYTLGAGLSSTASLTELELLLDRLLVLLAPVLAAADLALTTATPSTVLDALTTLADASVRVVRPSLQQTPAAHSQIAWENHRANGGLISQAVDPTVHGLTSFVLAATLRPWLRAAHAWITWGQLPHYSPDFCLTPAR